MLKYDFMKPYILNWDYIAGLPLIPVEGSNTEAMNVAKFIWLIPPDADFKNEKSFKYTPTYLTKNGVEIKIGSSGYHFENNEAAKYLDELISLMGQSGGIIPLLEGTWLFFEEDRVSDDPHYFYRFFLSESVNITVENIRISAVFDNKAIVQNLLISGEEDNFLANDAENKKAILHIVRDKWLKDTNVGQIHNMKQKIENETLLKQELNLDLDDDNYKARMVAEITQLRKNSNLMKIALMVISIILLAQWFFK